MVSKIDAMQSPKNAANSVSFGISTGQLKTMMRKNDLRIRMQPVKGEKDSFVGKLVQKTVKAVEEIVNPFEAYSYSDVEILPRNDYNSKPWEHGVLVKGVGSSNHEIFESVASQIGDDHVLFTSQKQLATDPLTGKKEEIKARKFITMSSKAEEPETTSEQSYLDFVNEVY